MCTSQVRPGRCTIDVLVAPDIHQTWLYIDTNLAAASPTRELQHKN